MFHWNQFPHVKNPNSLPGMTQGLGAPNILMNGFTLGQSHAITPQDIGEDFYTIRDDLSVSFNRGGRHDLRVGGEYMYHFTFETVCNQCMGQLDLRNGPVPANIESLIVDVNDVSTWNLAPLSNIARFYQRAIGMDELAVFAAFREFRLHRVCAASRICALVPGQLGDVAETDGESWAAVRLVHR